MIDLKYALEFDGFVQDSKDKRNLNIKFNGKEELFSTYSMKDYKWHLSDSVPKYDLLKDSINEISSFFGCAMTAEKIVDGIIDLELKELSSLVSQIIEALKSDNRTCLEIKCSMEKSMLLLLEKVRLADSRNGITSAKYGLASLIPVIESIIALISQEFYQDFNIKTLL